MSRFEWDDSLDVGVKSMNDQHQQIIDMINIVADDVNNGINPLANFDALSRYVVQHFSDEEAFMRKKNYSGYESHIKLHAKLLDRVQQFRADMVSGALDTDELFVFLRMWLKTHIKGIDHKYGVECGDLKADGIRLAS